MLGGSKNQDSVLAQKNMKTKKKSKQNTLQHETRFCKNWAVPRNVLRKKAR
jgi:hypothetical protein